MNWFFRQSREHLLKCRNLMEECFRRAITFLQRATTEQLAVLNKHDWLAAREEIIHYQCLSGAIQGLWKKPGCEAGGEQCSQLLPDTSRQKGSRHRLPQTRPPTPPHHFARPVAISLPAEYIIINSSAASLSLMGIYWLYWSRRRLERPHSERSCRTFFFFQEKLH